MPEMVFVVSTTMEAVGYDPTTSELYIRFLRTGETYVYYGVPESSFRELMQSDSKGQYFNQNIRNVFGNAKM